LANVRSIALSQFERTLANTNGASRDVDIANVTRKVSSSKDPARDNVAEAMPHEVADWLKNEWIKGWAAIDPPLRDIDLRPYVFVTRDKRGSLGGFAASAHLEELVDRLTARKMVARVAMPEVARLTPQELDEVFTAVSDRVTQADDMNSEPPGVQGLLVLYEQSPEMGRRLVDFARTLDVGAVGVWPAAMIANITAPEVVDVAHALLQEWSEQTENAKLKRAVELMRSIGKKK